MKLFGRDKTQFANATPPYHIYTLIPGDLPDIVYTIAFFKVSFITKR